MTDVPRPIIKNAPGLTWRSCKAGWEARWRPRQDLVERGYSPTPIRLWEGAEPSDIDRAYISDRCNSLQADMLVWGRGGTPVVAISDGTWDALIGHYQSDPASDFQRLRYKTRLNYLSLMRRISEDHGTEFIRDMRARNFKLWHQDWTPRGVAMAHSLMGMTRTLIHFGMTLLEDEECERLTAVLHHLKFKMGKKREEELSIEQAIAVRAKAHELGEHSIALAQAFQTDCTLRQKDVIGEWVPISEPEMSEIIWDGKKWIRGLLWSEIKDLILRHITSKKSKPIVNNLRYAPMVLEELDFLGELPTSGPVIVNEFSGLPWVDSEFRRKWRIVARAAGVPDHVYNMDSRSGAITEGLIATDGDLDAVRIAATHSNVTTTQGYSRGHERRIEDVMRRRVEYRNKQRTEKP